MRHFVAAGLLILAVICAGCLGSSGSDCNSECHNTPPATGAHLAHTDGHLPMPCDACHGEGASDSDHPGHRDLSTTLLGAADYEATYGSRPAWYSSVWGNSASYTGTSPSDATCSDLTCHGMDIVAWNQDAGAATYNGVCTGCHDITPAVFQLPGYGTVFTASTAAANYEGPISGFGRGGHGDSNINNPAWFADSAPGSSVPLACVTCHDADAPHFPTTDDNSYRMPASALANNLPGASSTEGAITNLCTQTYCHPKVRGDGDFGFLTAIKHPNDNWPITFPNVINMTDNPLAEILEEGISSTIDPAYDPVGRSNPVGLHIDRYIDHWAYWNSAAPSTEDTSDDEPFLPLGDPLMKQVGSSYDNTPSSLITCVTCHNPHGTDLFVSGQAPGVSSSLTSLPSNKMLRLRDQDGELSAACH
jgi:hypothetical protein